MSNFLIWHKSDFAKLTTKEIETLKAKMLKLPTMSMDIFDNVLGNIDENYPFSLSPKLILALLVLTGICVLAIGIISIWYKRKTSLTSSTLGNLIKLVPSLNEKVPTLNSLLPILSELTPSHIKNALPSVTVPQLPQLHLMNLFYHLFHTIHPNWNHYLQPQLITHLDRCHWKWFNHAVTDLNEKGVINLKRYKKYLHHKK